MNKEKVQVYYTIFPDKILVIVDEEMSEIYPDDSRYEAVLDAIRAEDYDSLANLIDKKKAVSKYIEGSWEITGDGVVKYKNKPVEGPMIDLILEFYERDLPFNHLTRFYEKLQENPSYRSRQQLWNFINKFEFPILPNGNFLAYKGVCKDRYDKHSRSIEYYDGAEIRMNRAMVSDDPKDACAPGLHVGTMQYASMWAGASGVVIMCEINPKDVVRVPYDDNFQKCAVCKLKVIREVKKIPETPPELDWTAKDFFDEDDMDNDPYDWGIDTFKASCRNID